MKWNEMEKSLFHEIIQLFTLKKDFSTSPIGFGRNDKNK